MGCLQFLDKVLEVLEFTCKITSKVDVQIFRWRFLNTLRRSFVQLWCKEFDSNFWMKLFSKTEKMCLLSFHWRVLCVWLPYIETCTTPVIKKIPEKRYAFHFKDKRVSRLGFQKSEKSAKRYQIYNSQTWKGYVNRDFVGRVHTPPLKLRVCGKWIPK